MKRGDGNLYITFNEMGHGDSILISLPNGKMVLIDCGTMRWDGNYWNPPRTVEKLRLNALVNAVADEKYLLNNKVIDVLILTHSDRDHHSELTHLFDTTVTLKTGQKCGPPTKAKQVFYSGDFSEYGKYDTTTLLTQNGIADKIYSITLNESQSSYREVLDYTTSGPMLDRKKEIERSDEGEAEILKKSRVPATKGFVKILDGTHKRGRVACGFYLLASNVKSNTLFDQSDQANRGSIVSMVVYGDKKFLFSGDATRNTERFLLDTYGDRIENLELVHVGHHASENTSSSPEFVRHVNPRMVMVSAAYNSGSHLALPRYEVLKRFNSGSRLTNRASTWGDTADKVYCWKFRTGDVQVRGKKGKWKTRKEMGMFDEELVTRKQIWCTGSHGAIGFYYKEQNGEAVFIT